MVLMTLIICIGLQWYFNLGCRGNRLQYTKGYISQVEALVGGSSPAWQGYIGLAVIVVPILCFLALLSYLADHIIILQILIPVVIAFYCLEACNYRSVLRGYLNAMTTNNKEQAIQYGQVFIENDAISDEKKLQQAIANKIIENSVNYFFGVVFWYIVFGIIGMGFYYAIAQIYASTARKEAKMVKNLLDWLPTRLAALSFALAGHFITGFQYLWEHLKDGLSASQELAIGSVNAALDNNTDILRVIRLLEAASVLWIIAIAIFTMGALIS